MSNKPTDKHTELLQALARGYCTDRNASKVLDADLIEDMAVEAEGCFGQLKDQNSDLIKQRDELLEGLKEIREIYAGMDGFIPETAPEGYQQRIIKQMYEVARNLINKIGEK